MSSNNPSFSLPSIHNMNTGLRTPPRDTRLPSVKSLLCDEPEPLPPRQLSPPLERLNKSVSSPMTPASTPPLYDYTSSTAPPPPPIVTPSHPAPIHTVPNQVPVYHPAPHHAHHHIPPPLPPHHSSHHIMAPHPSYHHVASPHTHLAPAPATHYYAAPAPTAYPPVPQAVPQTPKPKRRRATSYQVARLNEVFEQTFFPSSEQRLDLAKELNMTPRIVQIWFQNKRQGWKSEHKRPVPRN
ncbi:Homeobox protein [Yarrowia sp. C11]|nr:Homeobox protein [Yarrowia sp. C11]